MKEVKVWQMGMLNYPDYPDVNKPVRYSEEFLKRIADDTSKVDVTCEHENKIIGYLSDFRYADGVLYADCPDYLNIEGKGFSPVFQCDLGDCGDYLEPLNYNMLSVGLTSQPRSNILYNSIKKMEVDDMSDELRKLLDKKEEIISEQREELGALKKQNEEFRKTAEEYMKMQAEMKQLHKDFDDLKKTSEEYKLAADKLHEQEMKDKEKIIHDIAGDDDKAVEILKNHSLEDLRYMRESTIVTEPNKGVGGAGVNADFDGDRNEPEKEPDFFEEYNKWSEENNKWGGSPLKINEESVRLNL